MHPRRSRIVAYGAMSVGAVVVLGAVLVGRERLLERWYLEQLESGASTEQARALRELKSMGSYKLIDRLIELPRRDPTRSGFAIHYLTDIGEPAVPSLEKALVSESPAIRKCATSALIMIEPAVAMDKLLDALRHDAADVRVHALMFLARLRLTERERPAILRLLSDENSVVRSTAAWTLGRAGSAQSVPALIEILTDESAEVRRRAVQALGRIRSAQDTTIPAIGKFIRDDSPMVRRQVVNALRLLEDSFSRRRPRTPRKDVTELLLIAVRDPVEDVWRPAVYGLGECGTNTPEVEAALRGITREGSPRLRSEARFALQNLRRRARTALPAR